MDDNDPVVTEIEDNEATIQVLRGRVRNRRNIGTNLSRRIMQSLTATIEARASRVTSRHSVNSQNSELMSIINRVNDKTIDYPIEKGRRKIVLRVATPSRQVKLKSHSKESQWVNDRLK